MLEFLDTVLASLVDYGILLFEYVGVFLLIFTGLKGIFDCATQNPLTKLNLARGLNMGLEFKLGSEILRTVIIRELSELIFVAAIIAVRAALTLLIHWEIKNAELAEEKKLSKQANG